MVLTCTFCELPFRPTDAQLLAWADSGRPFDPSDWECPDCRDLDADTDYLARYGVDPDDVEPDDTPDNVLAELYDAADDCDPTDTPSYRAYYAARMRMLYSPTSPRRPAGLS